MARTKQTASKSTGGRAPRNSFKPTKQSQAEARRWAAEAGFTECKRMSVDKFEQFMSDCGNAIRNADAQEAARAAEDERNVELFKM